MSPTEMPSGFGSVAVIANGRLHVYQKGSYRLSASGRKRSLGVLGDRPTCREARYGQKRSLDPLGRMPQVPQPSVVVANLRLCRVPKRIWKGCVLPGQGVVTSQDRARTGDNYKRNKGEDCAHRR